MVTFREEEVKDRKAVEILTRKAFWDKDRLLKNGIGCDEHYLVHTMREADNYLPKLNLIAEIDGHIVGHIIYCIGKILTDKNESYEVINFGPISVLPEFQGKGIGGQLLMYSIDRAKELGYKAIFLYGHPTYYPKFGFVDAKEFNIATKEGKNFSAFMVMSLKEGFLDDITGRFYESDVYNVDILKACKYDESFK